MRNLKRALSLTLASVMLLGMMVVGSSAKGYDDVDDKDNVEAIEVLQTVEVMVGDDRGFGPDRPVTRNEMAVVMGKLLNLNYNYYASSCPFTDVAEWARGWVGACYANGIVSGRGQGIYDGEATVTAVEAASMMMRALGYFKYTEDYADGFQLVTVRQGSEIGIFNGVGTDASTPMTRNQVAQMALNALKANMVTFTGTPGIEVNGVKVGYRAEYTFRSGTDRKYFAISGQGNTTDGTTNQAYVQLGEELYDGDLRLYDNYTTDDFGRPARRWEYDGKEIGTYAKQEILKAEYTQKVTGKTLYELLSKNTIETYDFYITIDGNFGNDPKNFTEGAMTRTNTDAVGGTGNGVLTQVYEDTVNKDIYIAVINTYLAIAEDDYNEKKDEVSLNVYNLQKTGSSLYHKDTTDPKDQEITLKASGEDFNVKEAKQDDKFLVTVANGEIKSVVVPEILSDETINSYSKGNYVVAGQQYDYATTAQYDDEVMNNYDDADMKDITYNIVLDKYGYLIGIEENESPDQYLFLTGIEDDFSNLYNKKVDANAIFLDGTMKTITVDTTKGNLKTELTAAIDDANDHGSVTNTWCTYSVSNDNIYTLNVVNTSGTGAKVYQAKQDGAGVKISSKYVSLDGASGFTKVYGNDNTVYIDAEMDTVTVNDNGDDSLIVKDVKSVTTGVTKVDLEGKDLTTGATDYEPTNEVYTLHKDNGYIIAVVTLDADDKATSKSYVYVSSDDIHKRDWNADTKEWTWYREVILDGEFVDLIEVTDTNVAEIDDVNMEQNKWYEVSFNADGHVKVADAVAFEAASTAAGTTDNDHIGFLDVTKIDESVVAIDGTVILTAELTGTANDKLSIAGNTLYTRANKTDDGVYVSPSAKIIVFPNNSDDKFDDPETYSSLDKAVKSLENSDKFDGYIHAVIGKDGVATVVIIDEENVAPVGAMTVTVVLKRTDGTTISSYTDTISTNKTYTAAAALTHESLSADDYTGGTPASKTVNFVENGSETVTFTYTDNTANQLGFVFQFKDSAGTPGNLGSTTVGKVSPTNGLAVVNFKTNSSITAALAELNKGVDGQAGTADDTYWKIKDGQADAIVNAANQATTINITLDWETVNLSIPNDSTLGTGDLQVEWAANAAKGITIQAATDIPKAEDNGIDVPKGYNLTISGTEAGKYNSEGTSLTNMKLTADKVLATTDYGYYKVTGKDAKTGTPEDVNISGTVNTAGAIINGATAATSGKFSTVVVIDAAAKGKYVAADKAWYVKADAKLSVTIANVDVGASGTAEGSVVVTATNATATVNSTPVDGTNNKITLSDGDAAGSQTLTVDITTFADDSVITFTGAAT